MANEEQHDIDDALDDNNNHDVQDVEVEIAVGDGEDDVEGDVVEEEYGELAQHLNILFHRTLKDKPLLIMDDNEIYLKSVMCIFNYLNTITLH